MGGGRPVSCRSARLARVARAVRRADVDPGGHRHTAGRGALQQSVHLERAVAPGEVPPRLCNPHKCQRNFEAVHSLFKQALARGELDRRFDSLELAYGFYGQGNLYIVSHLVMPTRRLDRRAAGRIVDLFFAGAGTKKKQTGKGKL